MPKKVYGARLVTIADVKRIEDIINISRLALEAGMGVHTLHSKLRRGTDLNPIESKNIADALARHGLSFTHKCPT